MKAIPFAHDDGPAVLEPVDLAGPRRPVSGEDAIVGVGSGKSRV